MQLRHRRCNVQGNTHADLWGQLRAQFFQIMPKHTRDDHMHALCISTHHDLHKRPKVRKTRHALSERIIAHIEVCRPRIVLYAPMQHAFHSGGNCIFERVAGTFFQSHTRQYTD
jgi:hypothetical protein